MAAGILGVGIADERDAEIVEFAVSLRHGRGEYRARPAWQGSA